MLGRSWLQHLDRAIKKRNIWIKPVCITDGFFEAGLVRLVDLLGLSLPMETQARSRKGHQRA